MIISKIQYLGGLRTEAEHLRSKEIITTDAPVDNNGRGAYFSPTDLAATSLASCAMTIIGIAAEKANHDFSGSTVGVTKIMTSEPPRKIAKIIVNFHLQCTPTLNQADKERYERLAHTCPVALSLHPDLVQEFIFEWK